MRLLRMITAVVVGALVALIAVAAKAQTYDPENKWIGKAVRQQLRSERETWYEAEPSQPRAGWRERAARRHYYAPRRTYHERGVRERREHVHTHPETRVYGMTIRRLDTTGSTACYPPVEAYSVEANTEDGAWSDAQRNFENQVRAMVGERWMEVKNARDIEKQCWASSGNQSVTGRVAERVGQAMQAVTGNEGGIDGRKHRCRILAKPCQAPRETAPETKGVKPNEAR